LSSVIFMDGRRGGGFWIMYVEHPLVRKDRLRLRGYQEAVVAGAIQESTLVVLPTGLGKTVVAAMVAAHRLMEYPGSRILFLAPTKPLAVQHMRSLSEVLDVDDMCVLTGEDSPEKRRIMWGQSRMVFATPQTIENDILRGLDLSDVSLVVFDEAHRAVGDYSYVAIAKHYIVSCRNPMSLGLTASPSSEREKVSEICANLGIKHVEAKTDMDSDVRQYVKGVKVNWVRVELPEDFKTVQKLLQDALRKQLRRLKDLGYVGSADVAKAGRRTLLQAQHNIRADITAGLEAYEAASVAAAAIKLSHAVELLQTQGIGALDEYFRRVRAQSSKAVKRLMADHDVTKAMSRTVELKRRGVEHPKLDELVRIVGAYRGRKVLVFTQYRDSVDTIIDRFNAADILAHEFIGQASRGVNAGMSQKKQIQVLDSFREGKYTALVATSVAEEGLDIPRVDAVVFFEPVPSEIRTIQRRGRTGRSEAGEVYVLIAKGTKDETYYWASYHKEKKMGEIVRQMRKGLVRQTTVDGFTDTEGDGGAGEQESPQQNKQAYDFSAADGRVKVIVDVRERNSTIYSALKDVCDIELRQLPVGDYLLSDRVCVERKTMADFLQSIIDGRLINQLGDLKSNFQSPVLILEGVDRLYVQRDIHPNAVRGMLASVAVGYGIPIMPSEDEQDTAQLLYAIARREQLDEGRPVALRGERKPRILRDMQRFVVESLPNVSAVLADRLLERFGSVEAVFSATPDQLQQVEGIGAMKARRIREVIEGVYGGS
jgi:ERCC4-related helicase/ERCC4-type nuclease